MIKKIFLAILLVVGTSVMSYADAQKKISLNNHNHPTEVVELAYGNIIVSVKDVDQDDNVEVSIELENIHESNSLIIFDSPYNEKIIKKRFFLTYDKIFGGSRGKRYTDPCKELKFTSTFHPTERKRIFSNTLTEKSSTVCRIPIYIAKNKNKSGSRKLLLLKDVVELEISVQLKPDEEFLSISRDFDELIKSIESETFCSNKNHQGESLETLKRVYETKISDLKKRIRSVQDLRGYYPSDKANKKFVDVLRKLESISLDERIVDSCPSDKKVVGHKCKYCSLSYEEIYKRLENYYIDIHNRTTTKSKVMTDVEALYSCFTKNTSRRGNSSYKTRITAYYNKIKSL